MITTKRIRFASDLSRMRSWDGRWLSAKQVGYLSGLLPAEHPWWLLSDDGCGCGFLLMYSLSW